MPSDIIDPFSLKYKLLVAKQEAKNDLLFLKRQINIFGELLLAKYFVGHLSMEDDDDDR